MASGGGGAGVCNNNKRYRRSADDDGETSGRNKRCGVGPSSGANGDGESGDYYYDGPGGHAHETTADDGAGGEDYMYGCDDDEEAEQPEDDAAATSARHDTEQRYVVLTESDLRARQAADTATVAEVLSIRPGIAAVLLRHFNWRVARVLEEWFTDDRRVRGAVGLPAAEDGGELLLVPEERSPRPQVCGICFDPYPAGGTRSAGCSSHYYCDGCWLRYVAAAVTDGARCLSLRCPDPSCPAPVVRELVDAVAAGDAKLRARYARFWLRSYVEESGGRIKWCGGAGCARAVEILGGDADAAAAADVFCGCGGRHGFCWRCGEEAHGPVSYGTVRAWLAKNASDSETANWVAAHTKRCPKCRRPIEKNHGCNHMTCGAPCRHQFCWLCFDPWDNHRGCTRYDGSSSRRRQQQAEAAAAEDEEEARRRQAKASLDRYLYHYERWEGNGKSLEKAIADADELERSELQRMAALADVPAMELGFLADAYRQVADGRRVLRWAHAYAYFLFMGSDSERDGAAGAGVAAKRELFDDLQSQANRWLECLHGCAELERKELFGGGHAGADGDGGGESTSTIVGVVAVEAFRAYKEKVANLTGVARRFMGNLVKVFKTNLPEVVVTPAPAFDFDHTVNGPTIGGQTAGFGGIISTATATIEPAPMLPMASAPAGFWRVTPTSNVDSQRMSTLQPSSSSLISQETSIIATDSVQQHRPIRNPVQQPLRLGGHGNLLSNLSLFPPMDSSLFGEGTSMGLPNIGATTPFLQFNMSNMISSGLTATPSVSFPLSAPGQPNGIQDSSSVWDNSEMAASSSQPYSTGMDQLPGTSFLGSAMNVPIGLHPNVHRPPPKYVKIWEGTLSGQRQGQPVFICKLESWSGTVSKTVAVDWPQTMQIVRLIAQEHMKNKQYVGKANFLIFRTLNQHGLFGQLQEKKLCAVIQLPSQTLLLSMSDKAGRMIGTLFPENMVMFKPEIPSSMQQEKLQQQQEFLHHQLQLQNHQNGQRRLQQQFIQQQQIQQIQVSTQNPPMQQQKIHHQQLQYQELYNLQQQMMQQQLRQLQRQQQIQLRQQIQQQEQHMEPQQLVGIELDSDDDAREDWVWATCLEK